MGLRQFIHPHVVPNSRDLFFSVEHKHTILKKNVLVCLFCAVTINVESSEALCEKDRNLKMKKYDLDSHPSSFLAC